jgi:hypothetical protein
MRGAVPLNPVIGLDVAKGETEGQAFLDKGMPQGKHFNIIHTTDGFERFHEVLKGVEALTNVSPTVILEMLCKSFGELGNLSWFSSRVRLAKLGITCWWKSNRGRDQAAS